MRAWARFLRRRGIALAGLTAGLAVCAAGCSEASNKHASAASAGCPSAASSGGPKPGRLIVGINSAWNNSCNLGAIRSAGVTMERLQIGWSDVEPQRGRWTWGEFDKQFAIAARSGVSILPLLMDIPSWAGGSLYSISTNQSGFANYVAHVVARYGPGGTFWSAHRDVPNRPARWFEIWNEPYLPQFSDGGPNPAAYARLFRAAAIAGNRARPAAKFLLAADTTGETESGSLVPWIEPMYRAVPNLNRYIDGIAAHPYSAPHGPLEYTPGHETRFEFRRIESLRRDFAARGAIKPFWITEIGWSTCPASPDNCNTEAQQATYLAQTFRTVKGNYPWVHALFVYNYRDSPSNGDPGDKERWFGLIRRDGSPKPAWNVLRTAAR